MGTPSIHYAFGYLVPLTTNAYDEVYNPLGTAIQVMLIISSILIPAGIIMSIYGAVKAAKKS